MPSISLFFYYYYYFYFYFYSVVCLGESKSLVLFTPFFSFPEGEGVVVGGKGQKNLDHDMIPAMAQSSQHYFVLYVTFPPCLPVSSPPSHVTQIGLCG